MTISITFWEIALLIIAIAFIFLVAAAVRFLNNLKGVLSRSEETLNKVNSLIDDNKGDVQKLINNSTEITADIQSVTKTLTNISNIVKKITGLIGGNK